MYNACAYVYLKVYKRPRFNSKFNNYTQQFLNWEKQQQKLSALSCISKSKNSSKKLEEARIKRTF